MDTRTCGKVMVVCGAIGFVLSAIMAIPWLAMLHGVGMLTGLAFLWAAK